MSTLKILFLCTGNSARSIIAESILTKDGAGRFKAFSAGTEPHGAVNPMTLKVLSSMEYPTEGLRSKSWAEFAAPDAPAMDFIFTVCDTAAGEACPVWPGHPATLHWGIDDPVAVTGTELERERAFVRVFQQMQRRISLFLALPPERLGLSSGHAQLRAIGRTQDPIASSS